MKEQRRLAAIVSADVAGYSRLMGVDESGTLTALKAIRREIIDPKVDAHGGRIVKTTGDGLLLEFPSVVDAVRCVIEVQTAMATRNVDVPIDRLIEFRVGVNVGDVIIDEGDIFGDGVNVAARLQEIAIPGGVCMASRVHDDIRDRLDAGFIDGGEQTLKNIARPVRVWRWSFTVSPASTPRAVTADAPLPLPDKPSIAVMPFANMSGDPEQEYFCDGVTEDIITELSRFRSLFVIARNSTFTYKGRSVDVREVARELGVRYALEGSIRKASNRIRATAQLIDAATGAHLWAERYDRVLEDIFALQEELTRAIVAVVAPQVEAAELSAGRARPTSVRAYELALRARAEGNLANMQGDRHRSEGAIALAEDALKVDPDCVPALSTPAWQHWQNAWHLAGASQGASVAAGLTAAERAIALDPSNHEPHIYKGGCLGFARQYDEALAELRFSLELNANSAQALAVLGNLETAYGANEDALALGIAHMMEALRLNPRDPLRFMVHATLSVAHFLAGDYRKGVEWGELSKRQASGYPIGIGSLMQNYAGLGQIEAARAEMETLRRIAPELLAARLGGDSPFRSQEHRERQVRLWRLVAGVPE